MRHTLCCKVLLPPLLPCSDVGRRQRRARIHRNCPNHGSHDVPCRPTADISLTETLEVTARQVVCLPHTALPKIPTAFPISFIFLYAGYSANGIFFFMMTSVRPSTRTPTYQNSMRWSSQKHTYREET